MAKKKQAIPDAKRGNLFMVDPWKICLVWDDSDPRFTKECEKLLSADIDSVDGDKHPLFDDRVFIPRSDSKVAATIKNGVSIPVIVRKNGDAVEAVDGRQRVLDARAANLALEKQGEPTLRVPCVVKRGDDTGAMATMVMANEFRTNDEVFNKAKKANRLQERGMDLDEIADCFQVTTTAVRNWLKLLEMDDSVQKACRTGIVTVTEAIKWSKEDREKQKELLKAHKAATAARAKDPYKSKKGKKGAGRGSTTKGKSPGKAKIRALIEALPESKTKAALQWAVGDLSLRKAKESVKELKEI